MQGGNPAPIPGVRPPSSSPGLGQGGYRVCTGTCVSGPPPARVQAAELQAASTGYLGATSGVGGGGSTVVDSRVCMHVEVTVASGRPAFELCKPQAAL